MNGWTIGADVGQMLTGISAVTAAYVWSRGQLYNWRQQRDTKRLRNWNGYIDIHGIDSWYVHVESGIDTPSASVVLTVLDRKGNPSEGAASVLRQRITQDGMLARVPSPEESDFLAALRKDQGYGQGSVPVR